MAVDLEPATTLLGELVRSVPADRLDSRTPSDIPVGALVDHIGTLAVAFTAAARKDASGPTGPPPPPEASHLDPDWRVTVPRALDGLAAAWRDDGAWSGTTVVGGIALPGDAAGIIALDEVVLHGWDLARATGRPYELEDPYLEALLGFLTHMAEPAMAPARPGLFGPVIEASAGAPLLDRIVGLAGRDPAWPDSSVAA
jgi:uncharacterized protein (TIGR03086 family)